MPKTGLDFIRVRRPPFNEGIGIAYLQAAPSRALKRPVVVDGRPAHTVALVAAVESWTGERGCSDDHQRRALDFMLNTLGLQHAPNEAGPSIQIGQLEEAVAALRAENRTLRTRIRGLEHELYPEEAELEAFEHEMEGRIAGERERRLDDI